MLCFCVNLCYWIAFSVHVYVCCRAFLWVTDWRWALWVEWWGEHDDGECLLDSHSQTAATEKMRAAAAALQQYEWYITWLSWTEPREACRLQMLTSSCGFIFHFQSLSALRRTLAWFKSNIIAWQQRIFTNYHAQKGRKWFISVELKNDDWRN